MLNSISESTCFLLTMCWVVKELLLTVNSAYQSSRVTDQTQAVLNSCLHDKTGVIACMQCLQEQQPHMRNICDQNERSMKSKDERDS